jgi:hypothetical protein
MSAGDAFAIGVALLGVVQVALFIVALWAAS